MKFECIKDTLRNAVMKAERVTGKNLSLPALAGIFMMAKKERILLRATNLDVGIEIEIPAKVEKEGQVVVFGGTLSALLSGMSDKRLTIEERNGNMFVQSQAVRSTVKCLPHEDFPTLPRISGDVSISLPQSRFLEGVKSVWFAASTSDIKPEIACVYVSEDQGNMVFVATDSFRLAERKIVLPSLQEFPPFLVPVKNMTEIVRALESTSGEDDVVMCLNKDQISLTFGDTYVTSRILDGIFPDYKQIIPKKFTTHAVVLMQDIANALKLSHVFSDKFFRVDMLTSGETGKVEISSKNEAVGENTVLVSAKVTGEEIRSAFNQKYLQDGLPSLKQESVVFEFAGEGKPLLLRGMNDRSFMYLIMPLTI